jgi:hypothetical protein
VNALTATLLAAPHLREPAQPSDSSGG